MVFPAERAGLVDSVGNAICLNEWRRRWMQTAGKGMLKQREFNELSTFAGFTTISSPDYSHNGLEFTGIK